MRNECNIRLEKHFEYETNVDSDIISTSAYWLIFLDGEVVAKTYDNNPSYDCAKVIGLWYQNR